MLICPNEVVEAEDPGHEELDESMPEPRHHQTDKDREAHELTHLPRQPWCTVCVFEPKVLRTCRGPRSGSHAGDAVRLCLFVVSQ